MQVAALGNRSHILTNNHVLNCFSKLDLTLKDIRYLSPCPHMPLSTPSHMLHKSYKPHKELSEEDDIAFCLGYYKLIPPKYFNKPKHGTFVLHATDLPKGRGWAPINWALIRGDDRIHITSFKIDEGCDTGLYHKKSSCPIEPMDTFESAYKKVEEEFAKHVASIITELSETGSITLHEQVGEPTSNPRRRPEDSELDPHKTIAEQWNLLRATDNNEYPAFFKLNGKKVILTYEVEDE